MRNFAAEKKQILNSKFSWNEFTVCYGDGAGYYLYFFTKIQNHPHPPNENQNGHRSRHSHHRLKYFATFSSNK